MSKGSAKKGTAGASGAAGVDRIERRKNPRRKGKRAVTPSKASATTSAINSANESCYSCSKNLKGQERALFVEEEIGRIFCTEECIGTWFAPDIERLEKEYFKQLSASDLSGEEKEKLAHLRWITMEEPDEVWRQKTLSGDYRFTMISEFKPGNKPVWCVCICLFLRGEPSFLYLAFPTGNAAMVNHYRRGERVEWVKKTKAEGKNAEAPALAVPAEPTDGLADAWTETETLRAEINQNRRDDDIPSSEFELYKDCLEETLEGPDELWTLGRPESEDSPDDAGDAPRVWHFIRYYGDEKPGVWYVIVARETEDEEQLEILDSFPTRDSELVQRFRRGTQELGRREAASPSQLVH